MNAEERERNERWLRRMAALEDECDDCTGGAVPYFARLYPIPDTSGLTAEQAEAVLEKWRAEVNAAMAGRTRPQAAPVPATGPTPTQAPVA